ncbi:MAG TPA: NAD-dependent succinate-semialdehyde dehydrogenase [Dehalococcoidia bacterium]|nr:NAD-dependent succinate-semialdehyde dehydrogenase [Dehalococcoidia bacterium]
MAFVSLNPATEEVLATFQEHGPQEVEAALERAWRAYQDWRRLSLERRGELLRAAARRLRQEKDRYARLITLEMGKPIAEAEAEVLKCAWNCEYFADNAVRFLAPEAIATNASKSYVQFLPLGPVLAIMPWNFPFWQVFRAAAPALMAGNTVLLKHASNVPQCALAIEEVFREAGFPEGVFQTLLLPAARVEDVIADDRVRAVTLTGSDATGAKVAAAAGRHLKKTVLELGGSDPFIVLADADLEEAARVGARARNQNNGQSCIAAKRFIVEEAVADRFAQLLVEAIKALKVGDPLDPSTNIGPLARADLRDELDRQVRRSLDMGARLLLGGHRLDGRGFFYAPTVLADVTPEMPAFREETFGPVAALVRARDAAEAIRLANMSPYGLGAALWTGDVQRGQALAADIEAGNVFVNGMVASDPRLPFGGVKRSGYGRELSAFGIREFVNVQTVWAGPARGPQLPPAE